MQGGPTTSRCAHGGARHSPSTASNWWRRRPWTRACTPSSRARTATSNYSSVSALNLSGASVDKQHTVPEVEVEHPGESVEVTLHLPATWGSSRGMGRAAAVEASAYAGEHAWPPSSCSLPARSWRSEATPVLHTDGHQELSPVRFVEKLPCLSSLLTPAAAVRAVFDKMPKPDTF